MLSIALLFKHKKEMRNKSHLLFVCDYAKIFRLKFLANGFDVESLVHDPKAYIHTSRGRERG